MDTLLCFLFKFISKKKKLLRYKLYLVYCDFTVDYISSMFRCIFYIIYCYYPQRQIIFPKKKKKGAVFRTLTSVNMEKCLSLSCIRLFATSWTVAYQAPLSIEFSRQEYWSGLPIPSPGESSQSRDQTQVSWIAGGFFTHQATRKTLWIWEGRYYKNLLLQSKEILEEA